MAYGANFPRCTGPSWPARPAPLSSADSSTVTVFLYNAGDDDDDLDGDFEKWRETLWTALCKRSLAGGAPPLLNDHLAPSAQFEVTWLDGCEAAPPTLAFLARSQPKHVLFELKARVFT